MSHYSQHTSTVTATHLTVHPKTRVAPASRRCDFRVLGCTLIRALPALAVAALACTSGLSCAAKGPTGRTETGRPASAPAGKVTVDNLRCEYLVNPQGIDAARPRLNWAMVADQRGQKQSAYRVQVASSRENLLAGRGDLWDTGKVDSDQSIQVVYQGQPLKSEKEAFWHVRVWDKDGIESPWSEPACWTMGLLQPGDWKGKWIGLDEGGGEEVNAANKDLARAKWIWFAEGEPAQAAPVGTRFFRCSVTLPADRPVRQAHCLIAADNGCKLFVNGKQAGTAQSFTMASDIDITQHLLPGRNVLAVAASNAGDKPNPAGVLAALCVEFTDGKPLVVVTDGQWRAADKEQPGWHSAEYDDSAWQPVRELGVYGMAPWGNVVASVTEQRRLAARMLRREFKVDGKVKRAIAYVCGLGYYELRLNGEKVGDHVLDPGLTEYIKRALYVTYDVTRQVKAGDNAIGVMLGNGRFYAPRGKTPFKTETYGYPKMLLQMRIEYADGRSLVLTSDENWKLTAIGPIRANNDYDGEEYDARMEKAGWDRSGFGDSKWRPAQIVQPPGGTLAAQMNEPIEVTQTIAPVAMTNPKPGVYIYDLGQNIVGWALLTVQGPAGTRVTMRFAETLTKDGLLFTDNLRSAKATDTYVLKGQGIERYEPRFTYHGFRYVELLGLAGTPTSETIQGRVVHSAVERAGSFSCSNNVINRVYRNMLRGIRGNLRSIPTDCPQRDERQGWLGDIANESKAESFDFNMAAFFTKWLNDIQDAQDDKGGIPDVAPPYWRMYNADVTWPATYVIIPGLMYQQYGDRRILETHYPSMKKWIAFLSGFVQDGIISKDMYGDWCVPPEKPELIHSQDPARKTAGPLLATVYYCELLKLMSEYATILGRADEAEQFAKQSDAVAKAFNAKFFNAQQGQYDNGTQTSCILPLAFGVVPEKNRSAVFERLIDNITNKTNNHIGTGLVGGQWLMRTLSDNGRADLAYTVATQTTYPSWGYMAEKGATTIWELWNGDTADPGMNSHNHLMLTGDLGIWIYEYLAGIKSDPKQPGFKHIIMRPYPVGDLKFVNATHRSLFGEIISSWRIEDGLFVWDVAIPPNATAMVCVPAKDLDAITESGKSVAEAAGVQFLRMESGCAVFAVESGAYHFRAPR